MKKIKEELFYGYPRLGPFCDYNAHLIDVCIQFRKKPTPAFPKCQSCPVGDFVVSLTQKDMKAPTK